MPAAHILSFFLYIKDFFVSKSYGDKHIQVVTENKHWRKETFKHNILAEVDEIVTLHTQVQVLLVQYKYC